MKSTMQNILWLATGVNAVQIGPKPKKALAPLPVPVELGPVILPPETNFGDKLFLVGSGQQPGPGETEIIVQTPPNRVVCGSNSSNDSYDVANFNPDTYLGMTTVYPAYLNMTESYPYIPFAVDTSYENIYAYGLAGKMQLMGCFPELGYISFKMGDIVGNITKEYGLIHSNGDLVRFPLQGFPNSTTLLMAQGFDGESFFCVGDASGENYNCTDSVVVEGYLSNGPFNYPSLLSDDGVITTFSTIMYNGILPVENSSYSMNVTVTRTFNNTDTPPIEAQGMFGSLVVTDITEQAVTVGAHDGSQTGYLTKYGIVDAENNPLYFPLPGVAFGDLYYNLTYITNQDVHFGQVVMCDDDSNCKGDQEIVAVANAKSSNAFVIDDEVQVNAVFDFGVENADIENQGSLVDQGFVLGLVLREGKLLTNGLFGQMEIVDLDLGYATLHYANANKTDDFILTNGGFDNLPPFPFNFSQNMNYSLTGVDSQGWMQGTLTSFGEDNVIDAATNKPIAFETVTIYTQTIPNLNIADGPTLTNYGLINTWGQIDTSVGQASIVLAYNINPVVPNSFPPELSGVTCPDGNFCGVEIITTGVLDGVFGGRSRDPNGPYASCGGFIVNKVVMGGVDLKPPVDYVSGQPRLCPGFVPVAR